MRRAVVAAIAFLALQSPAWAHHCEEELGHHWEIPGYRIEMMTQIEMMIGVSLAVVVGLWLKQTWRNRRADQ